MLRPLTDVLRGGPSPSSAVDWTDDMQHAFLVAWEALARRMELVHPCPRVQLSLCVDASADHVWVTTNKNWVPYSETRVYYVTC